MHVRRASSPKRSGGQDLLDQTTVSTASSGAEEISVGLTQATEVNYKYHNKLERPTKKFVGGGLVAGQDHPDSTTIQTHIRFGIAIQHGAGRARWGGYFFRSGHVIERELCQGREVDQRSVATQRADSGNKVKIRTLDTVVAELAVRPDLIKVDVEGFEFEVLRGAENVLRNIRPVMLIEIHPPQLKLSGSSDLALMAFLESRGYAIDVIDRNPNSLYTILAKPTVAG